ncbi:TlpA disulfide reductase family protein [Alkalitalea saponilacus]|uniref:Thiol-disulfide isomerase or thioredoxin n=1 Tax=Alkalitalea saponilacus TaxID=889453 RepID=A0A1T5DBF9_9BACT|nr:TlpA disulfide reductase family protein [Alkalitalea saponilacus]SKB68863.1 Thiol-disulfide isomerase or thioredoxin [Alkalitalea saponilacus]
MRIILLSLLAISISLTAMGETREVPDVEISQLLKRIETPSDTIYVVNFWATWCLPCVKEIPEFNRIEKSYQGQPVQVIMASLDFPNQKESRVLPFLENHTVTHDVILTVTPRGGEWISRVDNAWTGAIPATLIINRDRRSFYEGEINYERLMEMIGEVSGE